MQFATGKHVVQRTRQAEGPGEKIIAQEHAGFVVPTGIDRVEMAAHGRLVQHVVVDQRGRVDHLHGRRQEDVVRAKTAAGQPAKQHQGRPQPLAAKAKSVLHQVVDERIPASQDLPEDFFDLVKPPWMGAYNAGRVWGILTRSSAASFMNTFLLAIWLPAGGIIVPLDCNRSVKCNKTHPAFAWMGLLGLLRNSGLPPCRGQECGLGRLERPSVRGLVRMAECLGTFCQGHFQG